VLESSSFYGDVKLEINIPAGKRGAFINQLSDFKDSEYEFLLDRNTFYEILEAREENGKLIILAEVL